MDYWKYDSFEHHGLHTNVYTGQGYIQLKPLF